MGHPPGRTGHSLVSCPVRPAADAGQAGQMSRMSRCPAVIQENEIAPEEPPY